MKGLILTESIGIVILLLLTTVTCLFTAATVREQITVIRKDVAFFALLGIITAIFLNLTKSVIRQRISLKEAAYNVIAVFAVATAIIGGNFFAVTLSFSGIEGGDTALNHLAIAVNGAITILVLMITFALATALVTCPGETAMSKKSEKGVYLSLLLAMIVSTGITYVFPHLI